MIKPILKFRAAVGGSPFPTDFTPEDEFEEDSEAAFFALALGCLSDEDFPKVEKAKKASEAKAKRDDAAKNKLATKTKGKAPENKSGGSAS